MNNPEELLRTIENHPLTQKIIEEKEAETLAKRKDAVQRMAEATAELEAMPSPEAATAELRGDLADAEDKVKELQGKINLTVADVWRNRQYKERAIRDAEAVLLESYDKRIDEAITFFRDKLDWLREPGRISTQAAGAEKNIFTEKKTVKVRTNERRVLASLEYCRNAIKDLEGLKLEADFDNQAVEDLKRGIPPIDIYDEITGEKDISGKEAKPLPGVVLEAIANASDYLVEKTWERVRKFEKKNR